MDNPTVMAIALVLNRGLNVEIPSMKGVALSDHYCIEVDVSVPGLMVRLLFKESNTDYSVINNI